MKINELSPNQIKYTIILNIEKCIFYTWLPILKKRINTTCQMYVGRYPCGDTDKQSTLFKGRFKGVSKYIFTYQNIMAYQEYLLKGIIIIRTFIDKPLNCISVKC